MGDIATQLMRLAGGDPFERVGEASESHQRDHGCGLHTAGAEVMQLAASYVRTNNATRVLDLGCGLAYSTLWLADAVDADGHVIGVDADGEHVSEAGRLADEAGLGGRIRSVVGEVGDVLQSIPGPFDAVHDDARFASAPRHLDLMISRLRRGGVLTCRTGSSSWMRSPGGRGTTGSSTQGLHGQRTQKRILSSWSADGTCR